MDSEEWNKETQTQDTLPQVKASSTPLKSTRCLSRGQRCSLPVISCGLSQVGGKSPLVTLGMSVILGLVLLSVTNSIVLIVKFRGDLAQYLCLWMFVSLSGIGFGYLQIVSSA